MWSMERKNLLSVNVPNVKYSTEMCFYETERKEIMVCIIQRRGGNKNRQTKGKKAGEEDWFSIPLYTKASSTCSDAKNHSK